MTNTSYLIDVNTPYRSVEYQYAVLSFSEYVVLLGKQIRRLDCETQYAVLIRRFDTSYPTGGYGVSVKMEFAVIRWWRYPIPAELDSLPHAHAQNLQRDIPKHQDSRIKKAQEFKTKTSVNSDIQDLPLRYQDCQERLLASFQDDAKYEHVGQDTRS
ncbi:hypothetical protein Tco_1126934, partial [Tanacetum coccineum]